MADLTPLQQVQADARRITLQRMQEQAESKAWQESKDGGVSLDDKPEVAVEAKAKAVSKKGKK